MTPRSYSWTTLTAATMRMISKMTAAIRKISTSPIVFPPVSFAACETLATASKTACTCGDDPASRLYRAFGWGRVTWMVTTPGKIIPHLGPNGNWLVPGSGI